MKTTIIRNLFSIDQHVRLYFKIVEEHLSCPPAIRKKYLRYLRYEIARYLLRRPDALMSDVCKKFGDPYDQMPEVLKLLEKYHARELRRRTVLFIVIVSILAVLLAIAVIVAVHYAMETDVYVHISDIYEKK